MAMTDIQEALARRAKVQDIMKEELGIGFGHSPQVRLAYELWCWQFLAGGVSRRGFLKGFCHLSELNTQTDNLGVLNLMKRLEALQGRSVSGRTTVSKTARLGSIPGSPAKPLC